MAKRAPILSESYNPVGERLRRITRSYSNPPVEAEVPSTIQEQVEVPNPEEGEQSDLSALERPPISEIPTGKELKSVSVRFRCTLNERKKWHDLTRDLSGDHSTLSHFIRAALLLLENSEEQLLRLSPEIKRLRKPATTDSLGITMYEQRISQLLYDALRSSGRPRG